MTDSQPPQNSVPSPLALVASSFLAQALDLSDDPALIAPELAALKEDSNASIYSVQLDSSIGSAAFLVYVYLLQETDADGSTGQTHYEAGLSTLQQAADRDTPGPRMVAHADTDAYGFILATTPATWRALHGEEALQVEATADDLPDIDVSPDARASVAEDLHRAIHEANDHASKWLAAVRKAGAGTEGDELQFTEEETALALFVLDNANVQPMLTALNLLVTSAQNQAGTMITTDQAESPESEM